jgi:hypothetical protein
VPIHVFAISVPRLPDVGSAPSCPICGLLSDATVLGISRFQMTFLAAQWRIGISWTSIVTNPLRVALEPLLSENDPPAGTFR